MNYALLATVFFTVSIISCNNQPAEKKATATIDTATTQLAYTIERDDPAFDSIVSKDVKVEIIAQGFDWSEGPLWVESEKMLLFSDVPQNTIYKWTEEKGKEVYLKPSGYTDTIPRGGEMGSNGLALDPSGKLILCQDGDRRMARMEAPLSHPKANFITIADKFNGKRFSSPNDLAFSNDGELYFTDPPYGLESKSDNDPKKEIPFNGVYKIKKNGAVVLLIDSLARPNGIAFLPGSKQLIIANSDPAKPNWYIYDIAGDKLTNGKIFYSAAGYDESLKGLPDGFKVDKKGNVIASGPGGLYFFNSSGKLLGKILIKDNPVSNCSLSSDEKTVYVTNDMNVLRIKLRR